MKSRKKIRERICAGLGAFVLTFYALIEGAPAVIRTVQAAQPTEAEPHVLRESGEQTAAPEEESSGSEQTESAAYPYEDLPAEARKALAEENIPLAGYETYSEAELSAMHKNEKKLLAAQADAAGGSEAGESSGETADTLYDWDTLVDMTYVPDDADSPISLFDAAYSSDILMQNGADDAHYIYREDDFTVKYTVLFNTSHVVDTGNAVIRIPSEMLKNRAGDSLLIRSNDGIALPLYTIPPAENPADSGSLYSGGTITPSNRTQFGYYIENAGTENETYVIVNYAEIKPGTTWFEIVYDKVDAYSIKDETTWSVQPEIDVQYAFEKECWVYTGLIPDESTDESTLQPISANWSAYLAPDWQEAGSQQYAAYGLTSEIILLEDKHGKYYAREEMLDANGRTSFKSLYENIDGQPVLKYYYVLNDEYQFQYMDTEGNFIDIDEEPKQAIRQAVRYTKDGEAYYQITSTRSENNQSVTVNTYYNSQGEPVYQEQTIDGNTSYYENIDGKWVQNAQVQTQLPVRDWEWKTYHRDSEALEGCLNTQAHIDEVDKTPGKVTGTVKGNLNSESQILSFVPQAARAAVEQELDLDKNIYVLWEIDIKAQDCTQPYHLYLDEYTSYSTGALDDQQNPLTYLYFDEATGTVAQNTDGDAAFVSGGTIVYVSGREVSQIPGMDENQAPYTSPYAQSSGYYDIGTSENVKVIAAYPRGNTNAEGVAIDTLEERADGTFVFIPAGAQMQGAQTYDLWQFVNDALPAEEQAQDGHGILAERDIVKQVLKDIFDRELAAAGAGQATVIDPFVEELAEILPQVPELITTFQDMNTAQIQDYIVAAWKNPGDDDLKKQIWRACEDYADDLLESRLSSLTVLVDDAAHPLKSYDKKTVYREVRNEANVVLQPDDQIDPIEQAADEAVHQRVDHEPNVVNDFMSGTRKTAGGGKDGWIDIFDKSGDDLFDSVFTFNVDTRATTFAETHKRSSAYFYDNSSYVHLTTVDDQLTAEPWGRDMSGRQIYGGSYVLNEEDYCYTAARIVVNERTFDIVDESTAYGASSSADEPYLIDSSDTEGLDRNWYIYVSYGTDAAGNTVWEQTPYATIAMEDYLAENPADYGNNSRGANVLNLDFTQDERQPFRIKVEHNTIDYQSLVSMNLTAAVRKDAPHLMNPEKPDSTDSLRSEIYSVSDGNAAFTSESGDIDIFKIRLRNYAGFYAQTYSIRQDEQEAITVTPGNVLTQGGSDSYNLMNRNQVEDNPNLTDNEKLTDDTLPAEAFGADADPAEIYRMSAYVDVSKLEKQSKAQKTSAYTNDLTHGRAHITYTIGGYEGYLLDNSYRNDLDSLSGYEMIPGKNRNTVYIYDLLPPGVEFEGYSGMNEKPAAGFLTKKNGITDESTWVAKEDIAVRADIVAEDDPAWDSWGGAENGNGRYLVRFTLTYTGAGDPEDYAVVDGGNWFFGVGVRFNANVSWERYTAAKNTPNLAVYVTPSETIGKHGSESYKDNGMDAPAGYEPFKNTAADEYKENFDQDPATPVTVYNRMYALSKELGEIARASSTAIGKQVRADADIYALYSDKTAVIKGENYTYNVNVENQAGGAVSGIILYDYLDGAGEGAYHWRGTFRSLDTSALRLNHIYPVVWCYAGNDELSYSGQKLDKIPRITQSPGSAPKLPAEQQWSDAGWVKYGSPGLTNANVRVVAIALYKDANHTVPYTLSGKQTLSYKISMKAPTAVSADKFYAHNCPNYCYVKVGAAEDESNPWVVQQDMTYYDDPGNVTTVLIGDRKMLKIGKHVESSYTDIQAMSEDEEMEFAFRLSRYMGFMDNGVLKQAYIPCANIQYRIFSCTYKNKNGGYEIDKIGDEVDAGVIHTTDENGEFSLRDGQCAVFQYIPSIANLTTGDTPDFDNYRVVELSKPYWYEFKSVDNQNDQGWYQENGDLNNMQAAEPQPADPYDNTNTSRYYRQTAMTITNTYRPVIYISKEVQGVPGDLPTTDGLSKEEAQAKIDAFNTFDYKLWIYEYPINRMTGSYFQNGDYALENDPDADGVDSGGHKASWLQFKEYYEHIGGENDTAETTYLGMINRRIAGFTEERARLTDTQPENTEQLNQLNRWIEAWTKLKNALLSDKEMIDAYIADAGGTENFFRAPMEDVNGSWVGDGYLRRTVSDRLILDVRGFSNDPANRTIKRFNNMNREGDDREDGQVLYTYYVGSAADIYDTPQGWIEWEYMQGTQNRRKLVVNDYPVSVQVRAGQVVAMPIYIEGGMMYSDFGIGNALDPDWSELMPADYLPHYCYMFQEDMDNKYWNDSLGRYVTIEDPAEWAAQKSWTVVRPTENIKMKNNLGVHGENFLDYDNNYRFKDICLEKSVEPAAYVPRGDEVYSVEKTAFVYRVTRCDVNAADQTVFEPLPRYVTDQMTWELWTSDADGRLLEKQMTGAVNDEGTFIAPIANYSGAEKHYTIKVRYAEAGYTYRVEELLRPEDIFGAAQTDAEKKTAIETKFPYIAYDAQTNTLAYHHDNEPVTAVFTGADIDPDTVYTLATQALYAASAEETSGALKLSDNDAITESTPNVEMEINNIYKPRNLTVRKSIIAKNVDNSRHFTMRVRRADLGEFAPTALRFYHMVDGERVYLKTAEEFKALQGWTDNTHDHEIRIAWGKSLDPQTNAVTQEPLYAYIVPVVQVYNGDDAEHYGETPYYYISFALQNDYYAEIVNASLEGETMQIAEEDWEKYGEEGEYIHLDPIDDAQTGLSLWKSEKLADETLSRVRNGDEGFMILSKNYISEDAGDFDEYARNMLQQEQEADDNKVILTYSLREKDSQSWITPSQIPDGYVFINTNTEQRNVNDLNEIRILGAQSVVIDLKGLCAYLGMDYNHIEYRVTETIPEKIRFFNDPAADYLYAVTRKSDEAQMSGDKDQTSVDVENQVTRYESIIYKRMGGNADWNIETAPSGDLVLELRDGSGSNRQKGVHWIATGNEFDLDEILDSANHGTTDADGRFSVHAFDGWAHPEDGNTTYFVKLYFNQQVMCNLNRSDSAQMLEIRENLLESDPSWGYLVGYETYGAPQTYLAEDKLTAMEQWQRRQNTIVNTFQKSSTPVEVRKRVYYQGEALTQEDRTTEFTFTVRQFVNGAYVGAPGIHYTIDGVAGDFVTDENGCFTLTHDQVAKLDLPLFSYWEIVESGSGDYRLLVDESGKAAYDLDDDNVLDEGIDGLAPSETAEEVYKAQQADAGFRLNTDLDMITGIPEGDEVVLSRLAYCPNDYWHMGIRFIQRGRDADGNYLDDTSLYTGITDKNQYIASGDANDRQFTSGIQLQISEGFTKASFKADDSVQAVYAFDMRGENCQGDIMWSREEKDGLTRIKENRMTTVTDYGYVNLDYCIGRSDSESYRDLVIPEYILVERLDENGMTKYTKHRVVGVAQRACRQWGNSQNGEKVNVFLPDSVTKIGKEAFCNTKTNINLSNSVEVIYEGAFVSYAGGGGNRNKVESNLLVVPQNVTKIESLAFGSGTAFQKGGKSAYIIGSTDDYSPEHLDTYYNTLDITKLKTQFTEYFGGANENGIAGIEYAFDQTWSNNNNSANVFFPGNTDSIRGGTVIIGENKNDEAMVIRSAFMQHMHETHTVVLPNGDVTVEQYALGGNNKQKPLRLIVVQADNPSQLNQYASYFATENISKNGLNQTYSNGYLVFTNLTEAQVRGKACLEGFRNVYYKDTLTTGVINAITRYVGADSMFPPVLNLLNSVVTPLTAAAAPPIGAEAPTYTTDLTAALWLTERRRFA